jgi:putative tryptophan/tyrosine transport system substrate-binding protein
MRRREFIAGLGAASAYVAVPRLARAQQGTRVRRVAVLMQVVNSPRGTALQAMLRNDLAKLGWVEGRNLQIDLRFADNDPDRMRANATEVIGLAPDVIVVNGNAMVTMVQQRTQTIPIVIFIAGDVSVTGLVKNLAHPEGNSTGVTNLFQSLAGKWVELLKEVVPRLQHVGVFVDAKLADAQIQGELYGAEIAEASQLLGMRADRMPFWNVADIARGFDAFAAEPDGGLVVGNIGPDRAMIDALALQYRIPTVCRDRIVGDCMIAHQPRSDELV